MQKANCHVTIFVLVSGGVLRVNYSSNQSACKKYKMYKCEAKQKQLILNPNPYNFFNTNEVQSVSQRNKQAKKKTCQIINNKKIAGD